MNGLQVASSDGRSLGSGSKGDPGSHVDLGLSSRDFGHNGRGGLGLSSRDGSLGTSGGDGGSRLRLDDDRASRV